jgi:hypothetical protein
VGTRQLFHRAGTPAALHARVVDELNHQGSDATQRGDFPGAEHAFARLEQRHRAAGETDLAEKASLRRQAAAHAATAEQVYGQAQTLAASLHWSDTPHDGYLNGHSQVQALYLRGAAHDMDALEVHLALGDAAELGGLVARVRTVLSYAETASAIAVSREHLTLVDSLGGAAVFLHPTRYFDGWNSTRVHVERPSRHSLVKAKTRLEALLSRASPTR